MRGRVFTLTFFIKLRFCHEYENLSEFSYLFFNIGNTLWTASGGGYPE